ncbi:MAG: 30S ribosomal protein S1 [Acidobacteria bacterium]|nr:30S ribosomal protein S1 [Acidobacteriota bacterium]MCB9398324.1 30S ribosomal protein S1 [Acidobacteriota bacterium]
MTNQNHVEETQPENVASDATAAESVETTEPAVAESKEKVEDSASTQESKPATETSEETEVSAEAEQGEASFAELLDQYSNYKHYRPGDIVDGAVVAISETEVVLDIGAQTEGAVPIAELKDAEGNVTVKNGDKLQVMVLRPNKDTSYINLSWERARVSKMWDTIENLSANNECIDGVVIEKVKGGFIVDIGVRAFLPTSLATLHPGREPQDLIGQKAQFQITKLQRKRGNIILSRKDLLKAEYEESRKRLLETLEEGAVVEGTVKNVTDYGAFIDLGGLDGLLHVTDMSWGRVGNPREVVEPNQAVKVKVLRLDKETEKVSLGMKQIHPDPWLSVLEKYRVGSVVDGKVLNLTGFGAFVELEPGVEGLVHLSELSWTKKVRNPNQMLKIGQELKVKVLDVDLENRKVSLSLRQTEENPWERLAERFPVGSRVKGVVRNITEFGAFIEIEEGVDGLVHISDFKWGERNANPHDYVKKGQEEEVVVLAVDSENNKVSLGIKQLTSDPFLDFTKPLKLGDIVKCTVSKLTDGGIAVMMNGSVEGFIRNSELNLEQGKKASDHYKEGEEIDAAIARVNHRERKVDLSVRKLITAQERKVINEFTKNQDKGGATLGDVMKHFVK